MSETKGKGTFTSNFGFLMASVGAAVGLGNLWGFPYKMGTHGGAAFLIMYLILVFIAGSALMLGEFVIGRKTGKAPIEAFRTLGQKYTFLGWFHILAAIFVMAFYCSLGAYCFKYFVANLGAVFTHTGVFTADPTAYFNSFLQNGPEVFIYTAVYVAIVGVIVAGGVQGGIEKFTSIALPVLFCMIVIVIIKSLSMPGSLAGVAFMFMPDMSALSGGKWVSALASAGGQMFFSLSLGSAIMLTYGSYLPKKESISKNAIIVPICDTLVAVMAGLAVMPAVFASGLEPNAGPGLLFITLQTVFNDMGFIGPIFGSLLYLLVSIAAVATSIAQTECCASVYIDNRIAHNKPYDRKKASIVITILTLIANIPCCFDALGASNLPHPLGFSWLDFLDLLSEGILMPIACLVTTLILGWVFKEKFMEEEICVEGNTFLFEKFYMFCTRFTAPLVLIMVLIGQMDSFFGLGIFG